MPYLKLTNPKDPVAASPPEKSFHHCMYDHQSLDLDCPWRASMTTGVFLALTDARESLGSDYA